MNLLARADHIEAERIAEWMQDAVADANRKTEPLRQANEDYSKSLTEKIYNDPVHRVTRFFDLVDQGFHLLFGDTHPVCAVKEEDIL